MDEWEMMEHICTCGIQTLTDEIPGQIRDALRDHITDCPLRNPKEQP